MILAILYVYIDSVFIFMIHTSNKTLLILTPNLQYAKKRIL